MPTRKAAYWFPDTTTAATHAALVGIASCRAQQDAKYGSQRTLSPDRWLSILAREFCEAGNEANEHYKGRVSNTSKLRAELIDVAAVAVAWVEALDAAEKQLDPCSNGTCGHACGCASST